MSLDIPICIPPQPHQLRDCHVVRSVRECLTSWCSTETMAKILRLWKKRGLWMISLQWPWVAVRNFTSYNALFVCFLANIIILDFWLKEHFYRESCIFSVLSHVSGSHFGYVDASVPFLRFRCPVSLLL